ncbi:hypothetical protein V492_05430 [Pseudogymnoascus sp. VKM F-4246]|nr:hypothetical protein V492_05430 [Pseudogymnoascus sp. VKM F-4246]
MELVLRRLSNWEDDRAGTELALEEPEFSLRSVRFVWTSATLVGDVGRDRSAAAAAAADNVALDLLRARNAWAAAVVAEGSAFTLTSARCRQNSSQHKGSVTGVQIPLGTASRREQRKQPRKTYRVGRSSLPSAKHTGYNGRKGLENLCQLRADEILSMVASGCRSCRSRCEYDDELQVIRQDPPELSARKSGLAEVDWAQRSVRSSAEFIMTSGHYKYHPLKSQVPKCGVPSAIPSPDDFLQWFSSHVSREPDASRGSSHIPESESPDDGARLLWAIPALLVSDVQIRWDHVQVIGQFNHRARMSYQDGLLRLCRSAYEVFSCQPTRLFLHGLYIRGSLVELWMFDRSGLYCSEVFDIQKDIIQFAAIIRSYQQMTDQELGKLDMIKTDEGGTYATLDSAETPSLGKLYLESKPIASSEQLIGTGTTCYRARMPDSKQWDHVVKLKWRWARDRPEDELLKFATEKSVWGVSSLDYYKEVESTSNLRRSMRWGRHRKFAGEDRGNQRQRHEASGNAGDGLAKYTEETGSFFQNRILAFIVTSPVGRPLHTFCTVLELLQVFGDAINLTNHSTTMPKSFTKIYPLGILIDLDTAIELDEISEEETGITGTRPFIAIGVLKKERHTYRHDLESFLYVFLWTIITNHTENPPGTCKLRQWSNGSWGELTTRKSLYMDQNSFQGILEEFAVEFESLKPLAECLRRILFPIRDGVIWTGTDESPEAVSELYDRMIGAFERAIIAFESGN